MPWSKTDLGRLTALCGLAMILGGCGGVTPAAPSAADPALVGTWVGRVDSSTIHGTLTMVLAGNGSIQTRVDYEGGSNSNSGSWSVSGSQFQATSGDTQFLATVSNNTMAGTWSRPNGDTGTFSAAKQ